jgi:hypothetical protein
VSYDRQCAAKGCLRLYGMQTCASGLCVCLFVCSVMCCAKVWGLLLIPCTCAWRATVLHASSESMSSAPVLHMPWATRLIGMSPFL